METTGYVHLLLSAPGQLPTALPDSPWRMWVVTDRGVVDPASAAGSSRLSPVSPRAERHLVAAVADDDVDTLGRLGTQRGPAQDAARVLHAGRLVTLDVPAAIDAFERLVAAAGEPWANKVLRRHWNGLHLHTTLAPSVPALYPVGRIGLSLLRAELLAGDHRTAEAVALLEGLAPQPAVQLALAATLLGHGDHQRVLDVTTTVENVDDLSALTLVARSVASRTLGDPTTALDAACAALAVATRSPAILATALEERAHLYSQRGDDMAARADLEALATLAGGSTDVTVPEGSTLRPPDVAPDEDDPLERARGRLRRRITGVGDPGTFGGRHHSTYRDEVATMFALGQVDAVEELLLGLMDAVEDEVAETGGELDPTFFLTLADLYQDSQRSDDLYALKERFAAAQERAEAATDALAASTRAEGEEGSTAPPGSAEALAPAPADTLPARRATEGRSAISGAARPPEGPPGEVDVEDQVEDEVQPAVDVSRLLLDPPPAADEPAQELTPVQRAVRGPRVRSL